MTDTFQNFVAEFVAAWATRDARAFLALWHPDGVLHYPLTDRPIAGREIGLLNDRQKQAAPDLVWRLIDWTARDDLLMLEWHTSHLVEGKRFDWRGIDKLRLKSGKIIEERVYADTALLRAGHTGVSPPALLRL